MIVLRALALLIVGSLAAVAGSQAQSLQYQVLTPAQPQTLPGKVEVVEFFSYGCPHCYHLHPHLKKWVAQLPGTAIFVRIPVSFGRREWGQLSRTYYALEAMGELARLDDALFDTLHKQQHPLFDEEKIIAWAAEHGVDADKFRAAFSSPAVSSKAMRAEQMSRDYKVSGVPTIVVGGKYIVLGDTHEEILKNARAVVDKSAAELRAAHR